MPIEFEGIHNLHSIIYKKALSYYFSKEYKSFDKMSDSMISLIEQGLKISPKDYISAINQQSNLISTMDQIMKNYDTLITLSTAGAAPPEIKRKRSTHHLFGILYNCQQLLFLGLIIIICHTDFRF